MCIQDLQTDLKGKILIHNYFAFCEDDDHFECQTNGVISDSIVQNWTMQALECYKLNSRCDLCPITKAKYSFKCQMKRIVDILLTTQGLPDETLLVSQIQETTKDIVA